MATDEKIRELAYAIWEQEGRPQGKDLEHYYRARQILEQQALSVIELAAPARAKELPAPQAPAQLPDKKTRRSTGGRRKKQA